MLLFCLKGGLALETLKQYLIIMMCFLAGEFIYRFFSLVVPGNVLGMILLLILLITGVVKVKDVEGAANTLIKNMALFFVPVGAGIMLYFNLLSAYAAAIIVSTVLSTFLVLVVTGHTAQALKKKRKEA